MTYGNFRLTPERCMEIWRAVKLTFNDPHSYNPLKSGFKVKGVVKIKGEALKAKLDYLCRVYRTEDKFIIAVIAYFAHFVAVKGGATSIHFADSKLIYEAYIYFTGKVESLSYEVKSFLSSVSMESLQIDPSTQKPIICAKEKSFRNFWFGDPVIMSVLCRFTTLNDIWRDGITDELKKRKNSQRSILTTIIWCAIKRYCTVNTEAIKKELAVL